MVFVQLASNRAVDRSTIVDVEDLSRWFKEWEENPEFILQRDFAYTGPTIVDTAPKLRTMTLEELGL